MSKARLRVDDRLSRYFEVVTQQANQDLERYMAWLADTVLRDGTPRSPNQGTPTPAH
jgi:hypothetical protein